MKRRIVTVALVVLLLVSLLMPFFNVYPHMALPQDVAQAFPGDVSGLALLLKGNSILPVTLMPALQLLQFREALLGIGVLLTIAGALLSLVERKYFAHISMIVGAAGAAVLYLFASYLQQLDKSILYQVMISAKWYLWISIVISLALFGMQIARLRKTEPLNISDLGWRRLSGLLCGLVVLSLFMPFAGTYVQSGTFATPEQDAIASRSMNGWQWLIGNEPLLQESSSLASITADPVSGGAIKDLVSLSDSASSVRNMFKITTHNGSMQTMALAAVALLAVAMVLQWIRKVDRWFASALVVLGGLLLTQAAIGGISVGSNYQFMGSIYQMMFLGMGGYTVMPLVTAGLSIFAGICAVMSIIRADMPYFNNPIPQRKRLLVVSIVLAAITVILLLTPLFQVNLYTPGKVNQANPTVSRTMSGLELIAFQKPNELLNPLNARGKELYTQEASKNGLSLEGLQTLVNGVLNQMSFLVVILILIAVASLVLLIINRRNKRLLIAIILAGTILQAVTVLTCSNAIPKDIGHISGMGSIFAAMGVSVFAAFFTGFHNYEELPKKYKLFLMMLPFLVAVLLFAYLPLSGWRYAFYNYKLGLPMDQQEFVGFKWFQSLFSNPAQSAETVRVLRNTFAMSGLGLATSWMPVAFAIFLSEIKVGWFKKFVQIFTTLPNFISWVLVFSFALTIFSLDTGIVNKLLLSLGIIHEPIAYLNSGEHIWIKMWLWNTWKSLGWGAIMYLAAIAGIDQELYEAARVDGAGRWRQIRHITIPGILPTFFVLLLLSISNVVNNGMEQYLVFQNAMNKSTIEVLDLYVFNISLGTRSTNTISMATAIGILKSLVSIVLLFLANGFSKTVRGESIV